MKRLFIFRSLSARMITGFVTVIVLTSLFVGLPAIWLVRDQLRQRAWSQLDQARNTTLSLYDAKVGEINSLAVITTQRPKMEELITAGDVNGLGMYLETLRAGAKIDLILLCQTVPFASTSSNQSLNDAFCERSRASGIQIQTTGTTPQIWLLGVRAVEAGGQAPFKVVVGLLLDDAYASELRVQNGMENILWAEGVPIANSLQANEKRAAVESIPRAAGSVPSVQLNTFQIDGQPYYSEQFLLPGSGVTAEVVLNVSGIYAAQTALGWILIGSMLLAAVLGSVLGLVVSHRISQPLEELAESAARFREGDLSTPVPTGAEILEVSQVAQTLESSRAELLEALTRLQQEKAWSNHVIQSIVEGIVILNAAGEIRFLSHGAERITGWSQEDVIGKSCNQVFRLVEEGSSFCEAIPAPGAKQKIIVRLAGERIATLSITRARATSNEGADEQVMLVFRDVSEEETIHRLLGQFLANITHEFRTPLSALAASTELLLDQAPDLNPAELQELLASLHLSVISLQTLVDNLLESSSIETGRFRVSPRPADLTQVIHEAANIMRPLLEKYHQRLVVDLPPVLPMVMADSRRMIQVLDNLLSNASKFGPPEATITIRAEPGPELVCVQVADQGPGIPVETQTHIFQRFTYLVGQRADARAGAGLGLSVVKAIVEAHGGEVGVQSRPEGGSNFWFTLPIVSEP